MHVLGYQQLLPSQQHAPNPVWQPALVYFSCLWRADTLHMQRPLLGAAESSSRKSASLAQLAAQSPGLAARALAQAFSKTAGAAQQEAAHGYHNSEVGCRTG